MAVTYTYRPEMRITNSAPMRNYDSLYQRHSQTGEGIGWYMGMLFPGIVREEGLELVVAATLCRRADQWMAGFMMRNLARWEKDHGRN